MTTERNAQGVDVLAVMDELLQFASRGVERDDPAREMIEAAHEARAAVAELVAADRELDAAADELAEAKRAKGNWRVNPLGHNHPAVARMRAAKARRAAALAKFPEPRP